MPYIYGSKEHMDQIPKPILTEEIPEWFEDLYKKVFPETEIAEDKKP